MKHIKILIAILTIGMFVMSCENDGGSSVISLESGIIPTFQKDASVEQILDLVKITSGEDIEIGFTVDLGFKDTSNNKPTNTDVVAVYYPLAGGTYTTTLDTNVSLPASYSLKASDVVAAFSELTSTSDLLLGDVLSITTRFTRSDGTILNIINDDGSSNTGPNFQTTAIVTTVLNYPVSCPSDISGTYLVTSTGVGCCSVAPITNYEYTVTVTDNGGGSYTLSDYSGGVYDGLFCGAFGICGDASSGDITDVCGTLGGSAPDCCGDNIDFSGTVNDDGTWTVNVVSGFMEGESTWTKQ